VLKIITNSIIKIKSINSHLSSEPVLLTNLAKAAVSRDYSVGDCLSLKELGQLAEQQRNAHGDTQEEAAARLELEQPNVSRAENGHSDAKETLFRLIAQYTDFEIDDVPHYCLIEK
jgi:DNA-binding XRE family transcriptional regulator